MSADKDGIAILIDSLQSYMLQIQQTNLLLKCADFFFCSQLLSGSIQCLFAFLVEDLTRQQYSYDCFNSLHDFYTKKAE